MEVSEFAPVGWTFALAPSANAPADRRLSMTLLPNSLEARDVAYYFIPPPTPAGTRGSGR